MGDESGPSMGAPKKSHARTPRQLASSPRPNPLCTTQGSGFARRSARRPASSCAASTRCAWRATATEGSTSPARSSWTRHRDGHRCGASSTPRYAAPRHDGFRPLPCVAGRSTAARSNNPPTTTPPSEDASMHRCLTTRPRTCLRSCGATLSSALAVSTTSPCSTSASVASASAASAGFGRSIACAQSNGRRPSWRRHCAPPRAPSTAPEGSRPLYELLVEEALTPDLSCRQRPDSASEAPPSEAQPKAAV